MNRNPLWAEAKKLRDAGYSYNMINEKLRIAKSTLSNWFKDTAFTPNREIIHRVRYGPMKAAQVNHNRKVEEIKMLNQIGVKEIGIINKRDLWMLGLGLYIGEGSKSYETLQIVNSDPEIIKLAIRWFKEICGLENENIVIAIHIYPDNGEDKCIKFWKDITGLPLENFRKTQIDRRGNKSPIKKNKLPYGTAHISIISKGNREKGVRLFRRIKGWINGAL